MPGLYALLRPDDDGTLHAFAWLGASFEAPPGHASASAFAVQAVHELAAVTLGSADVEVCVEVQDCESDEFWDVFDF